MVKYEVTYYNVEYDVPSDDVGTDVACVQEGACELQASFGMVEVY
jgi:hypothetical protein